MDSDARRWVNDLAKGEMLPKDGEGLHRAIVALAKVIVMRDEHMDDIVRRLWKLERGNPREGGR